jgi:hypothetical protein
LIAGLPKIAAALIKILLISPRTVSALSRIQQILLRIVVGLTKPSTRSKKTALVSQWP